MAADHRMPASPQSGPPTALIGSAVISWQTERALSELGTTRLDAVFVHNPEHLPFDQLSRTSAAP